MHRPVVLALVPLSLALPAPAASDWSPAPATAVVGARSLRAGELEITATDHAFEAPARVGAGRVTVRLTNKGQVVHHAVFLKVEERTTAAEVTEALKLNDWTPPWMASHGGPEGVAPGGEGTVVLQLEPGRYFIACIVASPGSSKRHFMDGMVRELVVDPPEAGVAAEPAPKPDATVTMKEWAFDVQGTLKPGRQVIRVQNYGLREHHMQLVKLLPGKGLADAMSWSESPVGAVPYHPVSGTTGLALGRRADVVVDLEPGTYALLCTLNDPLAKVLHTKHGMAKEVVVQE